MECMGAGMLKELSGGRRRAAVPPADGFLFHKKGISYKKGRHG